MDWIERWLGWSPDGGDGSVEVLVFVAIIAAAVAIVRHVRARRGRTQTASPTDGAEPHSS